MTKPIHLLQEHACPGACKRELYEGDVCFAGTCEYNLHDPFNKAQKEELCQQQQHSSPSGTPKNNETALLPKQPVEHVVTMRPAMYPPWPGRKTSPRSRKGSTNFKRGFKRTK